MERTEIEVHRDPRNCPADVRALLDHAEVQNTQFGARWYELLIDTVFEGDDKGRAGVQLHVARRDGQPMAVLALRADPARPGQVEALANFYTCLYAPAIAPGAGLDDVTAAIRSIRRANPSMASLRLAPMDPAAPAYALLMQATRAAGLRPFGFFCFGNWFLPGRHEWPSYLQSREGAVRSTLKRMGKKFAADRGTLELITDESRLAQGLEAYATVYAASWKNAEPFPEFMPGLIRLCAAKGWLRLGVAWLDGRAIAAQLWIVAHGRAEIYKLAYDEAFKSYSPGSLLTALLMQHAFEVDQVEEVDYLIGDDPYKRSWMTERRERWGIIAYDLRRPAGWIGWLRELAGRAVKRLRARRRGATASAAATKTA